MEKIKELFNKADSYFELGGGAKRKTHVLMALVVLFVIIISSAIVSKVTEVLVFDEDVNHDVSQRFLSAFSMFSTIILLVWLFIRFFEKRPFSSIGFVSPKALKKYVTGFLIGLFLLSTSFILIYSFSVVKVVPTEHQPNYSYSLISIFVALIFFMVQGAGEEILFRGWFMQTVGFRHWPWLGFLLSVILFTLAHSLNNGFNVLPFINLFLIATFLSIFIIKEKSLWGACGIHTGWNWAMGNVFGLSVSGNDNLGDSFFNLSITGNELITGGKFGVEASIIVTCIFFVGIIWEIKSFQTVKSFK